MNCLCVRLCQDRLFDTQTLLDVWLWLAKHADRSDLLCSHTQHLRVNVINPFLNRNSCQRPLFVRLYKSALERPDTKKERQTLRQCCFHLLMKVFVGKNLPLCLSISRWINAWECRRLFFQHVAV